jgi:hypothetical protein
MNYTESSSQPPPDPSQDFVSARARRRRAQRRAYFPADEAGRNALFEHLARRAFPSYELFVFSLVAGVFLGVGYFFNAQALLIFGILVAPLLTPWIGMSLSIVAGSGRLFAQTITALFLSSLLIFGSGLLAGFASRVLPNSARTFNEAFIHSRLWPPDLFALTVGASFSPSHLFVQRRDHICPVHCSPMNYCSRFAQQGLAWEAASVRFGLKARWSSWYISPGQPSSVSSHFSSCASTQFH